MSLVPQNNCCLEGRKQLRLYLQVTLLSSLKKQKTDLIRLLQFMWPFRELSGCKLDSMRDQPLPSYSTTLATRMPTELVVVLQYVCASACLITSDLLLCQQLMGFSVIIIHTVQPDNTESDVQRPLLHFHSQSHLHLTLCQFFS